MFNVKPRALLFVFLTVLLVAGDTDAKGKFYYGSGEGRGVHLSLPLGGEKRFRVRNVTDGDTIELENGEKVRYIGMDAPEERRRQGDAWVEHPEPYAKEATEENRRLVGGKKVRLEFDRERRDRFGRLLAYVYVPIGVFGNAGYDGEVILESHEIFVNAYLVQRGFAKPLVVSPNTRYAERFERLSAQAQREGVGLYARQR